MREEGKLKTSVEFFVLSDELYERQSAYSKKNLSFISTQSSKLTTQNCFAGRG